MSKKKNKFKKRKDHKEVKSPVSNQTPRAIDSISEPIDDSDDNESSSPQPNFYKTDKYDHVKKDIKKILFIMSIIILVLIGIYVLSLKTSILNTFGGWVYKILNIQAS